LDPANNFEVPERNLFSSLQIAGAGEYLDSRAKDSTGRRWNPQSGRKAKQLVKHLPRGGCRRFPSEDSHFLMRTPKNRLDPAKADLLSLRAKQFIGSNFQEYRLHHRLYYRDAQVLIAGVLENCSGHEVLLQHWKSISSTDLPTPALKFISSSDDPTPTLENAFLCWECRFSVGSVAL
jgi:hypothetical protein